MLRHPFIQPRRSRPAPRKRGRRLGGADLSGATMPDGVRIYSGGILVKHL